MLHCSNRSPSIITHRQAAIQMWAEGQTISCTNATWLTERKVSFSQFIITGVSDYKRASKGNSIFTGNNIMNLWAHLHGESDHALKLFSMADVQSCSHQRNWSSWRTGSSSTLISLGNSFPKSIWMKLCPILNENEDGFKVCWVSLCRWTLSSLSLLAPWAMHLGCPTEQNC